MLPIVGLLSFDWRVPEEGPEAELAPSIRSNITEVWRSMIDEKAVPGDIVKLTGRDIERGIGKVQSGKKGQDGKPTKAICPILQPMTT